MGINTAFSNWLSGAQSFATSTLRAAQAQAAALQRQAVSTLTATQQAAAQRFQPQTRTTSPHTVKTLNPVAAVAGAVQSGARAMQEGFGQITRAHAPIVQDVRRDIGRAIQSAPATVRSAPAAIQSGARQIAQAHSPIVQGIQRDVGRAIQSAPSAIRSAPASIRSGVQQVTQAHAPILQSVPTPIREGARQIARSHAPIVQNVQRDAERVARAITPGIDFANRRKAEAQASLTRTAGPARSFEQGWTYPIYTAGQEINRRYQQFAIDTEPIWSRTNPLRSVPEARAVQEGFSRVPRSLVESLSWIPPAAERGGQLYWKEPQKLPGAASRLAGEQYEGLREGFKRDPWGTGAELIGTAALSYGLGAAARVKAPRTTTRPVSGGKGSTTPSGSAASPSRPGAGGRFRGLEFGYRTELVQLPRDVPAPQKPFRLADWQAERQRSARGRGAVQVHQVPTRTQQARATYGPPYVVPQATISRSAPATTPQPALLDTVTTSRSEASPGSRQASVGVTTSSSRLVQVNASREDTILATIIAPPRLNLAQPLATASVLQAQDEAPTTRAPPPRTGLGVPPRVPPPLRAPPRKRERRKDPEEERRRRKKRGPADHWELGPAPGTDEMAAMIFGSGQARSIKGSALDFGAPSIGMGGVTRHEKTAHAGKLRSKKRSPRKQKAKK